MINNETRPAKVFRSMGRNEFGEADNFISPLEEVEIFMKQLSADEAEEPDGNDERYVAIVRFPPAPILKGDLITVEDTDRFKVTRALRLPRFTELFLKRLL